MNIKRLHHIGIAVREIDKQLDHLIALFQIREENFIHEVLEERGIKVVIIPLGDIYLEFITPISEESQISKFLRDRGDGLHHLAFAVGNLDELIEYLHRKNIRIVDGPRRGIFSDKVIFTHPKDTGGVLLEFMEIHD